MNQEVANLLGDELIAAGKRFKAGNSHITEDQAMEILSVVSHQEMSREEVCDELNINNSKFYDLIALGKIPAGRKRKGFKELYWYKDEIRKAINKIRHKD